MAQYAALDVSQKATAICLIDESGKVRRQAKVATCPETIFRWFAENAAGLVRIGMETGPLAVWLWNELDAKGLPVVCMDARHANAALKMRPNKTDRNDAAALAQIVRTGWFKQVRIKSRASYEIRSLLAAREVLVRVRVKLENEIRGLLRTFGVLFGKAAAWSWPARISITTPPTTEPRTSRRSASAATCCTTRPSISDAAASRCSGAERSATCIRVGISSWWRAAPLLNPIGKGAAEPRHQADEAVRRSPGRSARASPRPRAGLQGPLVPAAR